MKPLSLIGALAGAAVGALAWGAIAWKLNVEVGYVAWGIGLAVGFLSAMLGGRGTSNGAMCAVVALLGIFGGKVLAAKWSIPDLVKDPATISSMYGEAMKEVDDFKLVKSEGDHAKFMIDHGFTEATDPAQVTSEELADFKDTSLPRLQAWAEKKPTSEEFGELISGAADTNVGWVESSQAAVQGLGLLDILFAFLGIVTAFRVGAQSEETD
ncbi:MAG: hypothetical protein ABL949_13740 [Fimbriimonadaceae bacterium]